MRGSTVKFSDAKRVISRGRGRITVVLGSRFMCFIREICQLCMHVCPMGRHDYGCIRIEVAVAGMIISYRMCS